MNKKSEKDLSNILATVHQYFDYKYRKGNKEHGGDLLTMSELALVENAIDENVDQMVYLLKLRDKIMERYK